MEKIETAFRVVTPMFISGADQTRAELRLPSIKGALRFWWRALAWERCGGDLGRIRKEEDRLFGSTDTGQAAVLMKLSDQDISIASQSKWSPNRWEAYVGYGLVETTGGNSRDFIEAGSTFTVSLSGKRGSLRDDERDNLRKALLAFGLLGGLGGRARKGWGSVNLTSIVGPASWSAPDSREELKAEVDRLFGDRDGIPTFTAFSHANRVEFGPVRNDAKAAHRYLADHYKESVREGHDKRAREQFGLPRKENQQRRAGPVFLHVHELPSRGAVPLAAYLPARFLEEREQARGGDGKIQGFLDRVSGGAP